MDCMDKGEILKVELQDTPTSKKWEKEVAKNVGRYRGENGVANTKRGETFKKGIVTCINAPKLRAERIY